MKTLSPTDFVCMDDYQDTHPVVVDCAYARHDNQLFGEAIYKPEAKIWAYEPLAEITLKAAGALYKRNGSKLIIYDCLRTITAQEAMMHTARAKANPQWTTEPRLLSPPGGGAHPRGMAIDVSIVDERGVLADMGTPFDYLAAQSSPDHNPAHRDYAHLNHTVRNNRQTLDNAMLNAADAIGIALMPLAEEWWDFRLMPAFTDTFAPLSDDDLPSDMRCCG